MAVMSAAIPPIPLVAAHARTVIERIAPTMYFAP